MNTLLNFNIIDKILWYLCIALYKICRFITYKHELKLFKQQRKEILLSGKNNGYKISINKMGVNPTIQKKLPEKQKIYLGEIDQDGFLFPYYELFADVPTISRDNFIERIKNKIYLVVFDGYIGIEKRSSNPIKFLNEFVALINLSKAGFNVPTVLDVDLNKLTLTMSYIHGKVLREELAKKGAILRDSQLGNIVDCANKPEKVLYDLKIMEEGLKVMNTVLDMKYIENIHKQITMIHKEGFFIGDIKYGNIIIEERSGEPFFIDFEGSIQLSRIKCQRVREILKQKDKDRFSSLFGFIKGG